VWNIISPWPNERWGNFYFITEVVVGGIFIGAISTVWFTIGGTRDMLRMFKTLAANGSNMLDDGRVIGHIGAEDVSMVEKIDHIDIEEAHIEEEILREELEEEDREKDND
jgi:solute:Na+ symporter, SSS family